MKTSRLILSLVAIIVLIAVSCNILKKEDNVAEVKTFLTSFDASLALSNDEILKQFDVNQSKESLLTAIRILQNKEHEHIACVVDFAGASIFPNKEDVTVELKVLFRPVDASSAAERPGKLILKLQRKDKSFVITEFNGDDFHKPFAFLRSDLLWSAEQENETVRRQPIYQRAREIQQKFDSVIWFARYREANYFYVVNGDWNIQKFIEGTSECMMGIVDDTGKEIVPVEYTFIGTLGNAASDIVEVGNRGKIGYFDIKSKQLVVEPKYDMIIPYNKENAMVIVKTDSNYWWVDIDKQLHSGFPSQNAEQWVRAFGFVPSGMKISKETEAISEPPTQTQIGRGVFMPPSFLSCTGLFDRVIDGISTTEVPMNGWTEYVQTSATHVESLGENLSALITSFSERYLEGREEFYTSDRLVFVDNNSETLSVSHVISNAEITWANDSLLQVKALSDNEYETEFEDISGLPSYRYFKVRGSSIIPLETNWAFTPSKFVKLDSTFLEGNFTWYHDDVSEEITFMSLRTVTFIRNQMLASYGYKFTDPELQERFSYHKPATMYESIDEVRALMTDVERYNFDFLERTINRMQGTAM